MRFVLAFLVLSTACFVAAQAVKGVRFSFPVFNDSIGDNIKLFNDSYFEVEGDHKVIQLTTEKDRRTYSCGWAVYAKSIPVWDKSSGAVATFTTHFEFVIKQNMTNSFGSGNGLAFFMAPLGFRASELSASKLLGLFNASTLGNPANQIVAVEFDTTKDSHDPDDNHVGIDVDTILSQANRSVNNGSLKDGKKWDAWVDYDGAKKQIEVFLGRTGVKPVAAMLRYSLDLKNFLPENVMVGLSAATGLMTESHTLLSWDFSCRTFWNASSIDIEGTETETPAKKRRKNVAVTDVAAGGVAVVCGMVLAGGWWWFVRRQRRPSTKAESEIELDEQCSQGPRKFTYAELSAATKNFSEKEKVGQGGFGSVYRGVLRDTRELVAVKRVSQGSKQGKKEYVTEVSIISRLGHRNLVQLLGWCHERGELLLVYEYMCNGSLNKRIFGDGGASLDWGQRYNAACGVAAALVYLHEEWDQYVLHRDVKSSNVLLDSNFNAKLGDFGLARLVGRDIEEAHTTVVGRDIEEAHTTVVAGTLGYLAPECVITGKASLESDVFSFGVVALEIACGRRALDERLKERYNMRLVQWVWDLYGQGRVLEAAVAALGDAFKPEEMERLLVVGLWCSQPDPQARPTMRQALRVLQLEASLPSIPRMIPETVMHMYNDPVWPSEVLSRTILDGTCSQVTTGR